MEINYTVFLVINLAVYFSFIKQINYDNSYAYTFLLSIVIYYFLYRLDLIKVNNYTEELNNTNYNYIPKADLDNDYNRLFPTTTYQPELVKQNHKLDESIYGYGYYDDPMHRMDKDISKSFETKIPNLGQDLSNEISGFIPSFNPGYIPNYKAKNIDPKKHNELYTADSIRFI